MNKKILAATLCSMVLMAGTCAFAASDELCSKPAMAPKKGFEFKTRMKSEEHKVRVAEFEKRLNLTAEQKATIEKNRGKSQKKIEAIRKQKEKLMEEERQVLEQNRKDFEAVLTPEQKTELGKIKAEKRAKFEKMKKDGKFKENYKHKKYKKGCPVAK